MFYFHNIISLNIWNQITSTLCDTSFIFNLKTMLFFIQLLYKYYTYALINLFVHKYICFITFEFQYNMVFLTFDTCPQFMHIFGLCLVCVVILFFLILTCLGSILFRWLCLKEGFHVLGGIIDLTLKKEGVFVYNYKSYLFSLGFFSK